MFRSMSWHLGGVFVIALGAGQGAAADKAGPDMTAEARKLVASYESDIRPIEVEANRRWWDANVTGSDQSYQQKQESENKLDAALADRDRFARLKSCDGHVKDPLLARQIRLLYLQALPKQVQPHLLKQIVTRANAIEMRFNVFRAKVGDKQLADSDVRRVLHDSRDADERKAAWEASKGVGREVSPDLRTLVQLRNQSARELGFADFYSMQFELNEQKSGDVLAMFDELDRLTRGPFEEAKQDIDRRLAERFGIGVDELQPWHYHDPFFQEPPAVYETSLDAAYRGADLLELCRKFYRGIGLPIDDVLRRSDLYEKAGKSPHAFCTDLDREGDVRVLANVVPNEYWMGTMLHELGHSVYSSQYIPRSLPYVVRTDAHILATEGLAMMFERFSKNAEWLEAMGVDVSDPAAFSATGQRMRRNKLLIFSRWCQVMLRFEKELYRDPDQDLNALWWSLVERYQKVKRPEGRDEPDYASKIHIVVAPCYYHNYMLGELFACQLHQAMVRKLFPDGDPQTLIYVGKPQVGKYLQEHVFNPGRTLTWDELTRAATGEPLRPRAFVADLSVGAK
ncbi:MAG TPA: M2 family metallopeptidase [Pirellulales bacterium]|nr:M2 family metallopeptidase [Pirellulales bacterium]